MSTVQHIPTISAHSQERIDRTLGHEDTKPVWLDDIIIVTRGTKEEQTRKLRSVLTKSKNYRASKKKIKILPKRNKMARTHNITRLHRTKQTKTDAINKVEPPHKRQKIEILHGAIQYFAKFTPNFFEKTNMRQLLMKGTKLDWTTDRKTE